MDEKDREKVKFQYSGKLRPVQKIRESDEADYPVVPPLFKEKLLIILTRHINVFSKSPGPKFNLQPFLKN